MDNREVTVRIDVQHFYCPNFGIWGWSDTDYKCPLVFRVGDTEAKLYLEKQYPSLGPTWGGLDIWPGMQIEIRYPRPSRDFVMGLRSRRTPGAVRATHEIYSVYESVISRFEALCRTVGRMKDLLEFPVASIETLFESDAHGLDKSPVTWCYKGGEFQEFRPELRTKRRTRNPLFKKPQLLTKEKWEAMQVRIESHKLPKDEIVELLRIRSRLRWGQKRTAVLESAIMMEAILRSHANKVMKLKGISETRIKELKEDLTFNAVLNIVLPLSLSGRRANQMQKDISSVNTLRKIRNAILHEDLSEQRIDRSCVEQGIEGALKLLSFLGY